MKAQRNKARYLYTRDRDGCDDTFDVWDTLNGTLVGSVRFWDSVEGEEADAEEEARRIVRELNALGPRHVRAYDDVA